MSFLDDLTSYIPFFNSDAPVDLPTSSGELPITVSTPTIDLNSMLSPHYSLKSLTATTYKLSSPNIPNQAQIDNLGYMADALELLLSIGDFTILSGFRTKELQSALASAGEPVATGTSFHELGRAVDIAPSHMTIDEFFGRILSDEYIKSLFSEIAIKPAQKAIHLSVNVPGDVRDAKVLGLNTQGIYAKLNLDEIANYIAPYMASVEEAYDYAAAKLVTVNRAPLILGVAAAVGGVLYLALGSAKRGRTT